MESTSGSQESTIHRATLSLPTACLPLPNTWVTALRWLPVDYSDLSIADCCPLILHHQSSVIEIQCYAT